jgi:hypothetical protein
VLIKMELECSRHPCLARRVFLGEGRVSEF